MDEKFATRPIDGQIDVVSEIVSAYVARNHVAIASLPTLIESVHAALVGLDRQSSEREIETGDKPTPAQIRKSIEHDGIVSFIDGRRYLTLKRHLTKHGLDPKSYQTRFGLPSDYPMTAAAYSERRAVIARSTGLGVRGAQNVRTKQASKK